MKQITINLLGNSNLLSKQKRIKFLLSSSYIFLWLFSVFTIFHIYKTNRFISSIYLKEIQKISVEVTHQGPKFERIRLLNRQATFLEQQCNEYRQVLNRPSLWSSKMLVLSEKTPDNIRLEKLDVRTNPSRKKNKEYMRFNGIAKVSSKTTDKDRLNQFKKSLEQDATFMAKMKKISILETRIENNKNKPVMTFTMAIY